MPIKSSSVPPIISVTPFIAAQAAHSVTLIICLCEDGNQISRTRDLVDMPRLERSGTSIPPLSEAE